ncbi:hypothetical protein M885DRAFT_590956 [Pelagophyceae sp. CCMP2097]|nr:hypothetical protein M885DRAFT_590956 [Pelagophyceae sp. CCMP2097]
MGFDRLAGRAMLEHCSGDFDSTVELLKLSGSRPAAGARRADHLLKFTAPKREAVDIAASATAELLARRCPICLLDDCAAPVALKCGHAFCASCIVRHAMMNDVTRSKRCPCCQGSLDVLDLRPARWAETHAIAVGKPLELVLCERPKASRAAALVGSLNEGAEARLPRGPACSLQSKITLADDAASDSVFEAFFDGLRMAYAACEDSVERKDAESAKSALERVRSAYITRRAPDVSRSEAVPTGKKAPDALEERRYFFYAAADGQHVYLHPLLLNVFLAACGGDAAMLPKKLLLKKVQGLELFEQGAESRKKMPWLAHLQLGVDAHLADVSFDDIFSVEDSASFGWALKLRGALDCDAALKSAVDARTKRLDSQRRSERQSEKRDEARRRASEQKRPQAKKFELRQADFVALRLERDEKLLANLQNDSDDDGEASTDDELRNSPPVGPSFALLVSRGFAAELNCPALGPPPGGGAGPSTSPPPAPAWRVAAARSR